MRAYIDADVLIWHLRGESKALKFLNKFKNDEMYELWIGLMQRAEIIFFMRPNEEKQTLLFLSQFKTSILDQEIIDSAAFLYRQWNPSHGVDINDVILAATAIKTGGKIFCLNKKRYPMPEVLVEKAWQAR